MLFSPHGRYQDPRPTPHPPVPLPMIFEAAPRARWEYRVVVADLREEGPLGEERLSEQGADGWLLAWVVEEPTGRGVPRLHYYFVRAGSNAGG